MPCADHQAYLKSKWPEVICSSKHLSDKARNQSYHPAIVGPTYCLTKEATPSNTTNETASDRNVCNMQHSNQHTSE
jgi:hypothetical protein